MGALLLLKQHELEWLAAKKNYIKRCLKAIKREYAYIYCWVRRHPADFAALGTAIGTLLLAVITLIQVRVTKGQLDEMADEQRPWVYGEVPAEKPQVVPIKPNFSKMLLLGKMAFFDFKIDLTNTGHLPAMKLAVSIKLWPGRPSSEAESLERQNLTCEENLSLVKLGSIFPNQKIAPWTGVEAFLLQSDIDDYLNKHPQNDATIIPYGIACIKYIDPSGGSHETPYAFSLGIKSAKLPGIMGIPSDLEELAQTEFGVWSDEEWSGKAN